MQASMSEVVLPLDGRDDEVHHSTEMDQIGSSCRDESQLSSHIDDETLEDVDIVIDHALVQYFGTTLPSVTQNEHQPSPPPSVVRDEVPVEQELPKTSDPKRFSIDSVDPNSSIDRYGAAIDSNWDETETEFNYYLPSYAQEVVITTETNSPQAPDKEPSERLVTAPNDYSLDVIVPEKLGVQGFPFEEALNPLASTSNPNPLQEEFFDDIDLNPASLKDCRSFYEAQSTELSAEGSPENVSPGCSTMHIVPMSDGMLEVGTQSPPEELVGSVGIDVVGKNVIVERNPTASPDVARVPCSNLVCPPLSPPPSYRQTMAAAYQKTVYDPLSCCGPYGNVVKNKIVLSYSGEGVLSETDSRDSDYGPPKLDAIDDNHAATNDQPNDYPPMLEPADQGLSSSGKVAVHVIPSAAGEALESIKKMSLGVVPENGQEILEGCSHDELNECLGKLVPSITPEFSKEIPSGYIVNDMYNIRNITPESSTIATCVDDVGNFPDLLPVTEAPKLYRTFRRANIKKNKPVSTENPRSSSELSRSVQKVASLPLNPEPVNQLDLPERSTKLLVQNTSNAQLTSETTVNLAKKYPSTSSSPGGTIGPIVSPRVIGFAKNTPQQKFSALTQDDGGKVRANFKIFPTTAATINYLGLKNFKIFKPQNMKDKIILHLQSANVKELSPSDLQSASNPKKRPPIGEKRLSQASLDSKCLDEPSEPKHLATSSKLSNSIIMPPKDNSNDLAAKGTSKVAVSKSPPQLKVSIPCDSVNLTSDAVQKTDPCKKDDEPIEKAVTGEGDVDPNAIMDAMKVSVPYLLPVTKPEVKKIVKPEVGKVELPADLLQAKKKSAPPPVVVKMTSKANRKIFSPIREVEFSSEKSTPVGLRKPDSSLVKTNVTPDTKGHNLVASQQQTSSGLIIAPTKVASTDRTNDTVTTKVEAVVKTERVKERLVQPVSIDSKKKSLEPSLVKQVDNASDDLSSFLSSLSGPKERPKGVETLEKVVHETIEAASPPTRKSAPARTVPADDPIIIPPVAFRNDDPLSLKVGLKPCKFRQNLKKDELNKKPMISQSARSAPTSSRSDLLPNSKPTATPQCKPSTSKNSVELRLTSISNPESDSAPLEESSVGKEEDSQIESEEKVHPIVELINQLIESNSKSPQIFSEPDKTLPEESQVAKKGDEAKIVKEKVEAVNPVATLKNEETRAKEDGVLAGVVKERTSKLIQKARDLVSDVHVPCSEEKSRSTGKCTAEQSVRDSNMAVIEKTGNRIQTNNDVDISTAKPPVSSKDTKAVDGPLKKVNFPQKTLSSGIVGELAGGAVSSDKTPLVFPSETSDAPISSNVAADGAEAQKTMESKSSSSMPEKNVPSEGECLMQAEASTPRETPSKQQNLTNASLSDKVSTESKSVKNKDKQSLKTNDSPEIVSPVAHRSLKQQKQATPGQTLTNLLQTADNSVATNKTLTELKGNERKNGESSLKTTNSSKKAVASDSLASSLKTTDLPKKPLSDPVPSSPKTNDLPKKSTRNPITSSPKTDLPKERPSSEVRTPALVKVPILEDPHTNKSQTTTDISVSVGKKLEESQENTETALKRPSKQPASTNPVGEALEELKVDKVKEGKPSSKTTGSFKNTSRSMHKPNPGELLTEEPNLLQPTVRVFASKSSEDLKSKKTENRRGSLDTDSLKRALCAVKPPSKPKALTSDGQPLTKSNSCVSTDDTSTEPEGRKQETSSETPKRSVTPKTAVSSKKGKSYNEKLPIQLIVSIPTDAISNHPRTSDLLASASEPSEVLKGEKGKSVSSRQTVDPPKKPSFSKNGPLKPKAVSVPATRCEPKTIIVGTPMSACRTSRDSSCEKITPVKNSEKGPPVKQQTVPAVDRRTAVRLKPKSEVPTSTSDESVSDEVKGVGEPSEKVGSLEKHTLSPDERIENPIGQNSVKRGNPPTLLQITSTPHAALQHLVCDQVKTTSNEKAVLPESDGLPFPSLEKPAKVQKIPEKIASRMHTRGSVPSCAIAREKEEVKVEDPKETVKITEAVAQLGNDCVKANSPVKQPKISVDDKSGKRQRTRSETSSEKKVLDEGCTENLELVATVADDEHAPLSSQSSLAKSCVENVATCPSSQSTAAPVPSSVPKISEQKQDIKGTPTSSLRARGKIDRKPATVKPIPATPKKSGTKLLGNSKALEPSLVDGLNELDSISLPSNLDLKESAGVEEDDSETKDGNDDRTSLKTPVTTRRSSQKNKSLNSSETYANGNDDTVKPISPVRKSHSNKTTLYQDPKQRFPRKNLRVSMKPKKVGKLKNDVKNLVNDVYDFTDDEDQSIKIQTIDHYRKVSGKSSKNMKNSFSRFEKSQESLLSDDDNKGNNQARRGRKQTLKVVPGKASRRASPRKSLSEPRKSESKKGAGGPLKNVTSESTESLLSNSSENVLPAELQENLRNSRSESMRLAKLNRLKKSPIRKLTTPADTDEAKSPKPSSTREMRRSSGSRTSSAENLNMTDKKELVNVTGSSNRYAVGKEEAKSIEISTRETRRSSGASSGDSLVISVDKKEAKVVTSDRTRKKSPLKKDLNVADKLSREKNPEDSPKVLKSPDLVSVSSVNEVRSRSHGDSVSHVSTRSKSRESINEDETTPPKTLRNKGTFQSSPVVATEPKLSKNVEAKSTGKSIENKARHKIDKNDHGISNSSDLEPAAIKLSSTKEAGETVADKASSNRMITRSSGAPSKTIENETADNGIPKYIPVDVKLLPKLRSSTKRPEVLSKTEPEVVEVQPASKSMGHAGDKSSEMLPNKVESVNSLTPTEKMKKLKKADSVIVASSKDGRFPVDQILDGVTKPITIATGDTPGKEKHRRAKEGGMADGTNDMILSQSPLLSNQEVASRNAEAVSLKTPPMDSKAAQELDNVQPVGAMSQHGEPEGAKSSTRTAQLRSLVVPLDEDGSRANNSMGSLRKKNKKLVEKKMAQSPEISDGKPVVGEVITRKANDVTIKCGNKRSSVNCLVLPVEFDRHRTHLDTELVSTCQSKTGEGSKSSKHSDDVNLNQEKPNRIEIKPARRITRSSLSTSSPNLDVKTPKSLSRDHSTGSSPDLSLPETEPCSSKIVYSEVGSKPTSSQHCPSDLVKEKSSSKTDRKTSAGDNDSSKISADAPRDELEASKTSRSARVRKSKTGLKQRDQPSGKDEMKFAEPEICRKSLKFEKEKGALVEVTPGPPSGETSRSPERNMTLGKSKTCTKKDVLSKPSSYCASPNVGRVKTTTKDVCEISGEAEKLFEEANLDGKNGFDVIVPSPGKSPDSTTQNSSEIIIPILSPELDDMSNAKISEDAHGVTSTTEFESIINNSERNMLISSQNFDDCESSAKKEDESVSSTTVDTKILETNEVEPSLEHLESAKECNLPTKPVIIGGENSSRKSDLKIVSKIRKMSGETVILIPEHPKKIWRVKPVLNLPSTQSETTPKMSVGSLENEVSSVAKPHISDEELKKTPLKKRQVWAYSSSSYSNDGIKNKVVCKGFSPIEGERYATQSTIHASPSSEYQKSSPVEVRSTNLSKEKDASKKSNEIPCPENADGTCTFSSVDRLPHSICNILAAPTDKVTNEPAVELPPQATERSESRLNKTNREKLVAHNTRSKSKIARMVKRKGNKKSSAGMTLKSTKNRFTQKGHLPTRNHRVRMIKRFKIVQKTETNHKKVKLSPLAKLLPRDKNIEGVIDSSDGVMNRGVQSSNSEKIAGSDHSSNTFKIDDGNTISSPSKSVCTVQHSNMDTNGPLLASPLPKPKNVLEPVKQPAGVPSPTSKDEYVELIVDTTEKEIEDEESPPFSPIGVDTTKHSDWNSHSNTVNVESSMPFGRSSSAHLPSSFTRGFHDAPFDVPLEGGAYRTSHKMDRVRSYSNDEPDRSHSRNSKARPRRKSHPAENVPVDLSTHVNPVFEMKIPPSIPKLDLSGSIPVYHEALDQPPLPYELIPPTQIRPIPTPPPSYVPPQCHIQPVRPIPTLRAPSPLSQYANIANQFTSDEMRIELSSRMNAMSTFQSTKKNSLNPNFPGPKNDCNPLLSLVAHENHYILNASLSNIMSQLPSASPYMNAPSSMMTANKSRSGRGKTDVTASIRTPTVKSKKVKPTLPDSTEISTRDVKLHEAQVQLLITNPELSISRAATGGNGHSLTSENSVGSLEAGHLDSGKSKTSAFCSSSGIICSVPFNHRRQEEEIVEPLDVVTCELDEGSSDSSVHVPRMNLSEITMKPDPTLKQNISKAVPKDSINELKKTPVFVEPARPREVGVVKSVDKPDTVEGDPSMKNIVEKLPVKTGSRPRRRVSILDADKSYKKNSPTAVVSASMPTEVFETDTNSTPSSMVSHEPKENMPNSKTTTTVEENDAVLPSDYKPSVSIKTKNKGPSDKHEPCKSAETKVHHVDQPSVQTNAMPTNAVKTNETIPAKHPVCTKALKEPLLAVDGDDTQAREAPEAISKNPKAALPVKPNVVGPDTVKSVVEGIVNTIKEQGKVELLASEKGNNYKPKEVISEQVVSHKRSDSVTEDETDQVTKPNVLKLTEKKIKEANIVQCARIVVKSTVEPITGRKPDKSSIGQKSVVVGNFIPQPKTDKIPKPVSEPTDGKLGTSTVGRTLGVVGIAVIEPKTDEIPISSSEPVTDGKMIKSSEGQKPGAVEKSIPKPKTDEIPKPSPEPVAVGKPVESSVGQKPGVVGKAIPKPKTDEIPKPSPEPVAVGKPVESSVGQKPGVVGKAIPKPKTDEIPKPSSEPVTVGKPVESSVGQKPGVVEKCIPKPKTDEIEKHISEPAAVGKPVESSVGQKSGVVGKAIPKPKTDELPKPSSEPVAVGKPVESSVGQKPGVVGKAIPKPKTHEIPKPSSEPVAVGKPVESSVGQKPGVVGKAIPKPKTDEIPKPSSEPVVVGKPVESSVGQKPGVVEECIPKPKTDEIEKHISEPVAVGKPVESSVGQKSGVVGKAIPKPKTDEIAKPSSEQVAVGKPVESSAGQKSGVVGKAIPKPKTDEIAKPSSEQVAVGKPVESSVGQKPGVVGKAIPKTDEIPKPSAGPVAGEFYQCSTTQNPGLIENSISKLKIVEMPKSTSQPVTDGKMDKSSTGTKPGVEKAVTKLKTNEIPKPRLEPITDRKVVKSSNVQQCGVVEKSIDKPKTGGILKPSSARVTDGKPNISSVGQKPGATEKTIPKPTTPKSSSVPITDDKLVKSPIEQKPGVVEKSVNKPKHENILQHSSEPVTDSKPVKSPIEQKPEVVEKSVSESKVEDILKPISEPITDVAQHKSSIVEKPGVVEKSVPKPKTDKLPKDISEPITDGKLDHSFNGRKPEVVEKSLPKPKTDEVLKRTSEPVSEGKLGRSSSGQKSGVVEKSIPKRKIDEVQKPTSISESLVDLKLLEANIGQCGQRPGVVQKSIVKPTTDALALTDAKLGTDEIPKPSPQPITDGKLHDVTNGQSPGFVENFISKKIPDTSNTTRAHAQLTTGRVSRSSSASMTYDKNKEANIEPLPLSDAAKCTHTHTHLKTNNVSKPNSGPVLDDKPHKSCIEPSPKAIEKCFSGRKTDNHVGSANVDTEHITFAAKQETNATNKTQMHETNACLSKQLKMDVIPSNVIPQPKLEDRNSIKGYVVPSKLCEPVSSSIADDKLEKDVAKLGTGDSLTKSSPGKPDGQLGTAKLGTGNSLTKSSSGKPDAKLGTATKSSSGKPDDKLSNEHTCVTTRGPIAPTGAAEVVNEQKTVGKLESIFDSVDQRTSGCTDKPATECPTELKTVETVSLQKLATETKIQQVSATFSQVENGHEGPLKESSPSKLPPSLYGNGEKPTGKLALPNLSPLPPGGLLSTSSTPEEIEEATNNSKSCPNNLEAPPIKDALVVNKTVNKDHVRCSLQETVADSGPSKELRVIDTKRDPSVGKESRPNELKTVSRHDNEAVGKSKASEVSLVVRNDPPKKESAKQKEARDTICPATVETIVDKAVVDKVISATSPKVQKGAKNIVDFAAAEHVDQKNGEKVVNDSVTAQDNNDNKKPSQDAVGAKTLEKKVETDKPVISSEMDECSVNETNKTTSDDIAGVATSSETVESILGSAVGGETKSQDSAVADSSNSEPLSIGKTDDASVRTGVLCNKVAPKGEVTPSSPSLDALKSEENSSEVNEKLEHSTDEINSNVTEDSYTNEASPEPPTEHELLAVPRDEKIITEEPNPSPPSDKSHPLPSAGPSCPHYRTENEAATQALVGIASTVPGNSTDSCQQEQVSGRHKECAESSDVSPSVPPCNLDPVVVSSNLSEGSSLNSQLTEMSNKDISSSSSNKDKSDYPDPNHPDHQVVAGDSSATNPTSNTKDGDDDEIPELPLQTAVVDTVETVPNSTPETCAIIQSSESPLLLPFDSAKDISKTASISITRPERKRKRPARWSLEDETVASKLHKSNVTSPETPIELVCRGEQGEKIKLDPSVPKVEVELLCQSVIRKLQQSLGISIDQIDLAKLKKCWDEFHSSFSKDVGVDTAQDAIPSQSNVAARKSPSESLSVSKSHAGPSTSQGSDYSATIHSPASTSWMGKKDHDIPRGLAAILHERGELAKSSHLAPPTNRGEKRTVSQAFAQNVYIYKDPRVTGRSTSVRAGGRERRPLLQYDVPFPLLPSRTPIRPHPQRSYSWILEHLRERRKKNQQRESNIAAQPCKDFIIEAEEYTRPSLKEVYNNLAEGHAAPMLGLSRVSGVHEVPLRAGTSSSTTSRIPTFTISSDSEDSNPGNPEDTVNERDEVRRRIRRKSNTPSISSCSCPQSGHGSNRTTCPSCRKEKYLSPGAFSPIRSSRPPLYTEISHVERPESARVRGKRAATVGGGDGLITICDSEAAVRYFKGLLATSWPSDPDTSNDGPPIRDSFTSYQEDLSPPHVTVSPGPPPQSSSSAHLPPGTERATGATFQRCLQQKPFSERGHPEDSSDNVQRDSVISTERQMLSLLAQPGTTTGQLRAAFPAMIENIRVAGSRHGRHSGVGTDPFVGSHGCSSSSSSSSTTDDRGPSEIQPSEEEKLVLARFLHYWEDLTPEVRDEIKELSRQPSDPPDGPPAKKKKS